MNKNLRAETGTQKIAHRFSKGYADFNVRMNGKLVESVHRVILPEIDPCVGEMLLTLEFPSARSAAAALGSFLEQRRIEVFAAEYVFYVAKRKDEVLGLRWVMDAEPVSFQTGTVTSAANGGSSVRFRVYYYAAYLDGELLWEVDGRNGRCVFNCVDYSGEMY